MKYIHLLEITTERTKKQKLLVAIKGLCAVQIEQYFNLLQNEINKAADGGQFVDGPQRPFVVTLNVTKKDESTFWNQCTILYFI